ncbi:MAG TPA: L,D-transpeptidase [Sediminibacterium sp.]|nr:L,D-transpeptidase [Sediminibacterium sp.]
MKALLNASLLGLLTVGNTSFQQADQFFCLNHASPNSYYVVVEKRKYALHIFDSAGKRIVTYPVVFGNGDLRDKMMQGDRETPEGTFHITCKKKHAKWCAFLALDYPTPESYEKFHARKAAGLIPPSADIGGGIGIHGTWPHEDFAIDQYQNWTEGCISTKNDYILEIFELLPVGTTVIIRK